MLQSPQGIPYQLRQWLGGANPYRIVVAHAPAQNTGEGEALLSLFYNQNWGKKRALLGPKLLNALNDGNGAQVWYQIRYKSAKGGTQSTARRYAEAQMFGLWHPGDTVVEAVQDYEMLAEHPDMVAYDGQHYKAAANIINGWVGTYKSQFPNAPISADISPQTLAQAFHPAAISLISSLVSQYGALLPSGFLVDGSFLDAVVNSIGTGTVFNINSTDIVVAPDQTEVNNGFVGSTAEKITAGGNSPNTNHIILGPDSVGASTVDVHPELTHFRG